MPFSERALLLLEKLEAAREALGLEARTDCVVVSIGEQKLAHFRLGVPVAEYVVSTSRAEPSCVANSLGTPTGLHQVAEKIGGDQPSGMVFNARLPLGFRHWEHPDSACTYNLITSRILWLDGLQQGLNRGGDRDTKNRFVYIHGTNQASRLGTPNSHGCVLLGDVEMIRLYATLPAGAYVWIEDDRAPGAIIQ
jgi:hypothetical protein